nr:immunoglobulin heavy chain junction region [Macaca mulatta]
CAKGFSSSSYWHLDIW